MADTTKDSKSAHLEKAGQSEQKNEKSIKDDKEDKGSFWKKLSGVAEKGMASLKAGVEKIAHFTSSSAKLAKLKVEIHNLENEREKLKFEAGQKLWQLYKDQKLSEVESAFTGEFKKMAELRKQVAAKEKQAEKISLVE